MPAIKTRLMQNEFEKKVQDQMAGFSITPSDGAWLHIEKNIGKDKRKKRLVVFWWTAAFLMVAGGAGLWFYNDGSSKNAGKSAVVKAVEPAITPEEKADNDPLAPVGSHKVARAKDQSSSTVEHNENTGDNKKVASTAPSAGEADNALSNSTGNNNKLPNDKPQKAIAKSKRSRQETIATAITKSLTERKTTSSLERTSVVTTPTEQAERASDKESLPAVALPKAKKKNDAAPETKTVLAANGGNKNENEAAPIIAEKEQKKSIGEPVATIDSVLAKVDDTAPSTPAVAAGTAAPKSLSIPIKRNKPYFGFTVFAGLSDNKTGFPVLSEKAASDIFANSPSGQVVGSARADNPLNAGYRSGFSFGLGGFAGIKLSRRLALSGGINYQQYSASSQAGTAVNTQRNLYDSLLNTGVVVDRFYSYNPGSFAAIRGYTNKYHLLQFPVQIQYKVRPASKRALILQAGLTPSVILSTRALYFNRSANITYINREQFQQLQLFAQGGFQLKLADTKMLQYSLGPQIQYGISNLTRPVVQSRQHLFYLGLNVNIIFKK